MKRIPLLALVAGLPVAVSAFNGHHVTNDMLAVTIGAIPTVTNLNVPQTFTVGLSNRTRTAVPVTVRLADLIDTTKAVGQQSQSLSVPPRGTATAKFQFVCGTGTYSAHYPLHVFAQPTGSGKETELHAIQIFETDFSAAGAKTGFGTNLPLIQVPNGGAVPLASMTSNRVAWSYIGKELVREPVGWSGTVPSSKGSFTRGAMTRGADSKASLQMHPPYQPRAGTIFAEYRLQLPTSTPIRLSFFNAIRDSTPKEGTSDGVTFRVWANDQQLFSRHTDSKTWLPGEADLSAFAGKEILLRLESHPGPKNNTSCDASFWGEPTISIGNPPQMITAAQKADLATRARASLGSGRGAEKAFVFDLGGGQRAALVLGPNGITDAAISFGDGQRNVSFEGLQIAVRDQPIGQWPSGAMGGFVSAERDAAGRVRLLHRYTVGGTAFDLVATVWAEGPGLRMKVESTEPITSLGAGPCDRKAARVYYGHGYCITDPEPFRAQAGGHNMSTSHVGFDFDNGISLLTASDTPPDYLRVNPAQRLYQLHTHPNATLTFVPSFKGAFDCAFKYRPLYDKKAAPAVGKKAGRFVFDIWGGKYSEDTTKLARCFDYGVTNSMVIMHVWQRWGYDYRLPDIFPPLPSLGTLSDLQALGRVCDARGVLWGLHDNYIDLYPDATGYTYDHVTFTSAGQPRRAWNNEGREAQSYQFRPDHFMPFLKRNMDMIVPALHPTASFVDVFTSMPVFDFYDRDGKQHSKVETQQKWGECFRYIRESSGNNAPTTSEAGGDYLTGWLDGADCQFLQLRSKGAAFINAIQCKDWERVPWFDAVNHTRFSLHGVGYSGRYEGGRSREEHGIDSDDYISAEILTGHALMTDLSSMTRNAVRKYWLAQDFIQSIAMDEIADVDFAGGDLHRVVVTWKSGARAWVNRGDSDWNVNGRVLPQFGYLAKNGAIESSVERYGGNIAEQSLAPGKLYVNGRGYAPNAPLPITPVARRMDYLGKRDFRLLVDWNATQPIGTDAAVFYHFSRPTPGKRAMTEFVGGGTLSASASAATGRILTGTNWTITIPETMPLGEYEILVGITDKNRRRVRLLGDEDSNRRYRIGTLVVEGASKTNIANVRFVAPTTPFIPSTRWLANKGAVDFGPVRTTAAVRCETKGKDLFITPLPDGPDGEVDVRLDSLGLRGQVQSVQAIDAQGHATGNVAFKSSGTTLTVPIAKTDFGYVARMK